MSGIDKLNCDCSILEKLPREIWLKILDYVPLKRRLEKVQFVCQMFADLCNGPELTNKLDFKDCIHMPDELCERTITKNQNYVRYLSFRNCTWFSHSLYTKLPTLNNLVTLDLTGVGLSPTHLIPLLKCTPALQHLSMTIVRVTLFAIIRDMEVPMLQLKILHVNLLEDVDCYMTFESWKSEKQHVDEFLKSCSHEETYSVSMNILSPFLQCDVEAVSGETFPSGKGTIYLPYRIVLNDTGVTILKNILKNSGLHCIRLDSEKRRKWEGIRYVCLPVPEFDFDDKERPCVCDGASFPPSLPSLQYLSIPPLFECDNCQCFADTITGILFECQMPELTHLYFSFTPEERAQVPAKIYKRLGSFVNLIELNLVSLHLDLFTLMDAIKDLNHLRGLAFSVNESIINQALPDTQFVSHGHGVAGVKTVFFNKLVTTLPNLKKLELQNYNDFYDPIDTKDLIPISSLKNLQHLIINDLDVINTFHFVEMCRDFQNIRSLTFGSGSRDDWECVNVTKRLHSLQSLTYFRLSHSHLPILETLKHLQLCKQLRKVDIIRGSDDFSDNSESVTAQNMIEALDALLRQCKLIAEINIFCGGVYDGVEDAVSQYERKMRANRRSVVISYVSFCKASDYIPDYSEQRLSIISTVATCTPFDLFVG